MIALLGIFVMCLLSSALASEKCELTSTIVEQYMLTSNSKGDLTSYFRILNNSTELTLIKNSPWKAQNYCLNYNQVYTVRLVDLNAEKYSVELCNSLTIRSGERAEIIFTPSCCKIAQQIVDTRIINTHLKGSVGSNSIESESKDQDMFLVINIYIGFSVLVILALVYALPWFTSCV